MKSRNLILLSSVVALILINLSCAKNNKEDLLIELGIICDTSSVGYAADVKPIFEHHCSTSNCHSTITKAGNYDLENYQGIKDAVLGTRLLGTINHSQGFSPMPKGTNTKLSDCEIQKITKWTNNGALNN